MKILFAINSLVSGGAEKLASQIVPNLNGNDFGFEIELLILSKVDERYLSIFEQSLIKVHVVPSTYGHIRKMKFIKELIETRKFDLIHANLFPMFYYISIIKMLSKDFPKIVLTEHNTDNKRRKIYILKYLEKIIYLKYDAIISITEATEEKLLEWLKIKKVNSKFASKFIVIENGVDVDFINLQENYLREEFYFNKKDIILVTVGSFSNQKNHEFLLECFAELPKEYKLILIGEGLLKVEMENLVKTLKIDDRVLFLGFRSDVISIVKCCDIIVVPSKWEGFGLVAVEGMAAGLPVIASNVPGLSKIVKDTGLLFEPNNKEDFIDKLKYLSNKENRDILSKKSVIRAQFYDIKKMYRDLSLLYRGLNSK